MKNKIGFALIISGVALMLLVMGAFYWLKKQNKIDVADIVFFSLKVPENSFVEDVIFEITDATEFIVDTVFIERHIADVEKDVAPKKEPAKQTKRTGTKRSAVKNKSVVQQSIVQSETTVQKPSHTSFTNDFTIIGGAKIRVEFWNPDKNFLGYHLSFSQNKILLFGIKQFDPLRFEKYGEKQIIMYHKNIPYLLEEKLDIEPLQKFSIE